MNTSDEQWKKRTKAAFDESVDGLDAATLSRLNRARQQALAHGEERRFQRSWWMPATAAAAALVLAVVMLQTPNRVDVVEAPPNDLDILLGEENIDMLEELEFYTWLEEVDLEANGDIG